MEGIWGGRRRRALMTLALSPPPNMENRNYFVWCVMYASIPSLSFIPSNNHEPTTTHVLSFNTTMYLPCNTCSSHPTQNISSRGRFRGVSPPPPPTHTHTLFTQYNNTTASHYITSPSHITSFPSLTTSLIVSSHHSPH